MNITETATRAAKGADVRDWLDHIAWTDVIEPRLAALREARTRELVQATLNPGAAKVRSTAEVAGEIHGIDYVRNLLQQLIKDGRAADVELKQHGISLKD
jgi:flagellar biosynthesis regulator FlaF